MEKNKYNSKQLEKILDEVRACTLFFVTKNGKIDCPSAEEYLTWINQYSKYCIPEMAESWKENVRKIIYSPLVPKPEHQDNPIAKDLINNNNYVIIDNLYNFMNAGKIMQVYNDTKSWEEVDKVLTEQGHSGYTFSGLLNVIIQYSLIGVEFVDKYDPNRIKRDKNFKKVYNQSKSYIENRTELNKRLVRALSKKGN